MRIGPVIAAFIVLLATALAVRADEDGKAEKPAATAVPSWASPTCRNGRSA